MKKFVLSAWIVVFIIQLAVPISMIYNKHHIVQTGVEYKFRVTPVDPYEPFRGRYVSLGYQIEADGREGEYGNITVGQDGYARINKVSEKPLSDAYIKSARDGWFSMPADRYYMDEEYAPEAEELVAQRVKGKNAYVTARVKDGTMILTGLYINGVPIENVIKGTQ